MTAERPVPGPGASTPEARLETVRQMLDGADALPADEQVRAFADIQRGLADCLDATAGDA